ncbi:pseudouridine synthase [Candidatus Margulisiibacteriota bacterium]
MIHYNNEKEIRIQKYLSEQGLLSRRKAEEYLKKGWIKINGKVVTELGTKIDPQKDKIELDDNIEKIRKSYIYLAFNKPRGVVTNCPKEGEKEIKDLLPKKYQHLSAIGRLDKDSEGLILLTDDGIFAKSILNAKEPHQREYLVWINKELTEDMKKQLENGVYFLGKKTLPATIEIISPRHFKMTLVEGRNRQIRRMLKTVNAKVVKLMRIKFGKFVLSDLHKGDFEII